MSHFCKICSKKSQVPDAASNAHVCCNLMGSASSMETVGAYRIFERSENHRKLQYTDYYGDGDSKAEANPQVYVETPLHPVKLTVCCALWAGGIIGPYFFKNDEGHNITVNGDRYRAMITNFFIPELNNHDVQELWFQQDGATCHTARATIDLLKDTFGDRLISRFGPVNWPPRSCDLTPLDYFLWGYVKSLVYADKPQTLDHLEDNIRRVIADIRPQMMEKVIENWTSRLDYIRASRGSPMPEIIFKI
ncbi:putative transposable element [Trichonephila clavipes]|nr:putative transposable element [Trichonephila clavipes]